jgi:hypothetical protein
MEKETTGSDWSAADLADLQQCAVLQTPVEEIAYLLWRTETEVREKAGELDLPLQQLE